jgi:TetR/AcrR family transcriptional regulator, transcriptional repressor for nem operon
VKKKEAYNPDATRNDILQAAFKEIYVHGYQAASLNRILANVNHTKGALYHHFSNKKSLGLSVVEDIISNQMYSFFMKPLEETNDPIPVLCSIFQKKIDTLTLEEIKYGCPLNNLTQEMSSIDKDFYKSLKLISDKWIRIIVEALDRGKLYNNVRTNVNSNGTSILIVASIEGAFGLGKTSDSSDFFELCMKQLQDYLITLK